MSKAKVFITALLLSVLAFGLWRVQEARTLRDNGRRALWQAYLQGPLSDYLYASTRSHELLGLAKLAPADKAALAEAAEAMQRSSRSVTASQPAWQADPFFDDLVKAAAWHAEAASLAATWTRLDPRAPAPRAQARTAAAGIGLKLAQSLDEQRQKVVSVLKPRKEDLLEMNALIYAVKEGTTPAPKD